MNYTIKFELDGKEQDETFEADRPGEAFAMVLKKYPQAKLLSGSCYGDFGIRGEHCEINYDPPVVQRAPVRVRMGPRRPKKTDGNFFGF